MLNENIKNLRKSKGLSQEELAIKLNVVRQTVSKWENGVSQSYGYRHQDAYIQHILQYRIHRFLTPPS